MKIYVNDYGNIKYINAIKTDEHLREIEVDRQQIFGEMSEFKILNYKYIESDIGYSLIPQRNYDDIERDEKIYNLNKAGLFMALKILDKEMEETANV